jgi:hypothetical protein
MYTDDLSTAPGALKLGEEIFMISKGTDAMAMSVLEWALAKAKQTSSPLREVMKDLKDIPKEYHKIILEEATRAQASGAVSEVAVSQALFSLDGCSQYIWLASREHHPDLTLESIRDKVSKLDYKAVFFQIDEITQLTKLMKEMGKKLGTE